MRFNFALNASNSAHLFRFDGYNSLATEFDLCWNACRTTSDAFQIGPNNAPTDDAGTIHSRRNTWYTGNPARETSITGILNSTREVIRYTGTLTTGSNVTVTNTDNLTGTSGLIDTTTLQLTGTDRTNYLGIRGHEVA